MLIYGALGLLANVLFSIACITMAWKTLRAGADIGTPLSTMWSFLIANASYGAFLFGTFGMHWLFANAVVETVCWYIALHYHYWPRAVPVRSMDASGGMALFLHRCTRPSPHEGACNGLPRHECGSNWINRPGQ